MSTTLVITPNHLKKSQILTVEPGLYLADEGIGIRIEDNILLTEQGHINLSQSIIKEIVDIESFMSKKVNNQKEVAKTSFF